MIQTHHGPGPLDVSVTASGADGAIVDGVNPALKASVVDLTTNDAVAVAIVDGNGDQITSFGGGTQYTEDAAAAANPVGTALILVREDARAGGLTTTDGDNVAARGNDKGELYTHDTDLLTRINANSDLVNDRVIVDASEVPVPVTDNGGSLTVDNSALTSIDSKVPALGQALAAASVPVVLPAAQITTLTPPAAITGFATEAKQDTEIASLASIDGKITAVNTGAVTISAALPVGNNNIGDVDVVSLPAIPSGTNTIGSVKLTDGTDVADVLDLTNSNPLTVAIVDATGDQITSFGGGTQYTEDIAAAADPIGTMGMAVRADSLAAVTTTDGDNIALRATNKGELYVKQSDAVSANIVSGQTGVTAGAGAVAANTPRVTLASDDPAVATLGATTGTKVITDANGTLQQYLRGLIYLLITTANFPTKQFFGSAQTVINTATDIAAGNFSGSPAATYDNTNDGAVPYARYAVATLAAPDWAAAPVAGTTVDLYGVINNVDGTSDETDAPSGTSAGGAHYFGSWYIAAADALQRRQITIDLLGITSVDFYIKNSTAQNMNNDGGTNCLVKVTPLALGVTA